MKGKKQTEKGKIKERIFFHYFYFLREERIVKMMIIADHAMHDKDPQEVIMEDVKSKKRRIYFFDLEKMEIVAISAQIYQQIT